MPKALRGARAKVSPVKLAYKRWLLSTFGTAGRPLGDFGVQHFQGSRHRLPCGRMRRVRGGYRIGETLKELDE